MAAMPTPTPGHEEDAMLVTQCLDFCQTLAGKSLTFSFSLTIGTSFSFSVDTSGKGAVAPKRKKKKLTPSAQRRNARRREEFLKRKVNASADVKSSSESEPVSDKEAEAPPKVLHHHPSPPPSSERRQVITVGKGKVATFNQLDGVDSPPAKSAGGEEIAELALSTAEDDLVLPHYRGDNRTRIDDSGDRSVFACYNCFHLWRTQEEVDNCECTTLHDCSPYCLFVNVVNKDCDSDL